jgi:hypothetical protein
MVSRSARSRPSAVAEISASDLRPGHLGEVFRGGAKAVVLHDDPRVLQLWRELVDDPEAGTGKGGREILPWNLSVSDIARNHRTDMVSDHHLGDLFQPGTTAYIGRKILVYRDTAAQSLKTMPDRFAAAGSTCLPRRTTLGTAWELGSQILESLVPGHVGEHSHGVTIERLKYDASLAELKQRQRLMHDSSGNWAKIGRRVDAHKEDALGSLDIGSIRNLYAVSCLLPGLRSLSRALNGVVARRHRLARMTVPACVVGGAHTDGRYFHCLASRRTAVRTEILADKGWQECHFSPETLTIWPGTSLPDSAGIEATRHRILHLLPDAEPPADAMNISLILGAIPMIEGVSPRQRWPDGNETDFPQPDSHDAGTVSIRAAPRKLHAAHPPGATRR